MRSGGKKITVVLVLAVLTAAASALASQTVRQKLISLVNDAPEETTAGVREIEVNPSADDRLAEEVGEGTVEAEEPPLVGLPTQAPAPRARRVRRTRSRRATRSEADAVARPTLERPADPVREAPVETPPVVVEREPEPMPPPPPPPQTQPVKVETKQPAEKVKAEPKPKPDPNKASASKKEKRQPEAVPLGF